MSIDTRNLIINRIILHLIFERDMEGSIIEPHYSNQFIELSSTPKATLTNRIVKSIGSDTYSVEMEIDREENGSIFDYIKRIDTEPDVFIELSKKIALRLAQSQNKRNLPGGAVIIFDGTIGTENDYCFGIIKAEDQEGFNLREADQKIVMEFLDKLILTPQQKLYKVGMFIKCTDFSNPIMKEDLKVLLYDSTMNAYRYSKAAKYFYEDFLGLKHLNDNKQKTKDFYVFSKKFILEQFESSSMDKIRFLDYLNLYITDPNKTLLQVEEFSFKFPIPSVQDDYTRFLRMNYVEDRGIVKDLTFISKLISNKTFKFMDKVKISVKGELTSNNFEIISEGPLETVIKVMGRMKIE